MKTLEEIIAECAAVATVPEGAWEAEQDRIRAHEVGDELESTIPGRLRWARFQPDGTMPLTPEQKAPCSAEDARRSVLAVRCANVVWMGPSAAGKSSLAVACLRRWVASAKRAAMFGRAHHLGTARIQHKAGAGEAPYVARCIAAPLLLIDDLGSEGQSQNNACSDVIRDRVDEGKPLWITTGLSASELTARYDGGAIRRIFEQAMVIKAGAR